MRGLDTYQDMTPTARADSRLGWDRARYITRLTDRALFAGQGEAPTVGAAWSEALRGAAEMRRQLAAPFEPGRTDTRDNTLGMPWTAVIRGAGNSPYPVLTAHMYPATRRNGWVVYQPGTDHEEHARMCAERMAE